MPADARRGVGKMILAIAALVLQFPLPQSSLPSINRLGPGPSATSQPARPLAAAADAKSTPAAASDSAAAAFQPGRLVPEPLVAATPAAINTVTFPSSPEAAAFIASTPVALRANREEQRRRHIWLALSVAQSSAATFDAWSTRRSISNGGQELNPMLRPFSGNASLYVAIQATPLLLDYVGHRMMTSDHGWARHTWWLPQAIGTAMSIASGAHNLSTQ